MNTGSVRTSVAPPAAPSAVSALVAVATPTAPDRPAEHVAAAPRRFAELLRQSRSDRASVPASGPAAPPPEASQVEPTPGDDTSPAAPSPRPMPRANASARAPVVPNASRTTAVEIGPPPDEATAIEPNDDGAAPAAAPSTDERAADLAALAAAAAAGSADDRRAVDTHTQRSAEGTGGDGEPSAGVRSSIDAIDAIDPRPGALHARGDADDGAGRGRAVPGSDPPNLDARTSIGDAAAPAAVLGDALRAFEKPLPAMRGIAAADAVAASLGTGIAQRASAEPPAIAAQPAALAFATPTDAPDFASALGVQVSLLAADGIQHAELHLHPAETGPVSIHIALDGTSARVDFGADLAATRAAIERGLPELASALRDAGLTLTGGGVSQHAGSRQGDGATPGRPQRGWHAGAAGEGKPAQRTSRRVAVGGVDLYA